MRFDRTLAFLTAVALVSACSSTSLKDEPNVAASFAKLRQKGTAAWDMKMRFIRGSGDLAIGSEIVWVGRGDFQRGVADSTLSINVNGGDLGGKTSFECDVVHQGESIFARASDSNDWVKVGASVSGPDPMTLRDEGNTLEMMIRSSRERPIGPADINGIAVMNYELMADLAAYQKAFDVPEAELAGVEIPKVLASIDSDGLPRRFEIDFTQEDFDGGWSLSFSDFGSEVSVMVPTHPGPLTEAVRACFLGFPPT